MMKYIFIFYFFSAFSVWAQNDGSLPPPPAPPVEGVTPAADPNLNTANSQSISSQRLENEIVSFLEPYIYDADGRRDPFKPYELFKESDSSLQQQEQNIEEDLPITNEVDDSSPVLRYNLSQLRLRAILWSVRAPKIIISDQSGTNYILKNNDPIGNNGGYIADIREGEVLVIEQAIVQGKEVEARRYLTLGR